MITLFDMIYIAGFLYGDGSIIAQQVKKEDSKLGYQIRVTVQFTQKQILRLFLEQLKDLLGVGYIRDRSNKTGGLVTDYVITDTQAVLHVFKLLLPHLCLKQKQAALVRNIIEQLPLVGGSVEKFIVLASKVDEVALLNDSKSRKHTYATVLKALKTQPNK